ncbi:MAG: hypothetical protein Tsb008_20240 [Rhodothalassiaceae bacterium]
MAHRPAFLILIAAFLGTPAIASDFYVAAHGGLSLERDQTSRGTGGEFDAIGIDFDPGFEVGGSIGYLLFESETGRIRTELELSYRENSVNRGFTLDGEQDFFGDASSLAGMLVAYYDFLGLSDRFIPFIGAGAGIAGVENDVFYRPQVGIPEAPPVEIGGKTDTEFAWQAIIGVAIPITGHFDFTADGRFYSAGSPDWVRIVGGDAITGRFKSEFETWHITAGFRFRF